MHRGKIILRNLIARICHTVGPFWMNEWKHDIKEFMGMLLKHKHWHGHLMHERNLWMIERVRFCRHDHRRKQRCQIFVGQLGWGIPSDSHLCTFELEAESLRIWGFLMGTEKDYENKEDASRRRLLRVRKKSRPEITCPKKFRNSH